MADSRTTQRRSFLILLGFTGLFFLLVGRLAWVQLRPASGTDLSQAAVKQRQPAFVTDSGRGHILDRNGQPLTGVVRQQLVLFPLIRNHPHLVDVTQQVAELAGVSPELLLAQARSLRTPEAVRDKAGRPVPLTDRQAVAINRLGIPGLAALPVTERYPENGLARHLIGFVHRNPAWLKTLYPEEWEAGVIEPDRPVGASGLERSFDRFLQAGQPTRLSYRLDGQGRPLGAPVLRLAGGSDGYFPLSLVTTLDRELQRRMEAVADEGGLTEGSIVVLDTATGDALAVVSRPQYDPRRVDVASGRWHNRAVRQIPPGSVFKTVVAAAALAEGAVSPTETFFCDGEYGKYGFSCWKPGGHGWVTLDEAFAQSCNVAFARIAVRLGGEKLEEYAARLGLSRPVGWSDDEEGRHAVRQWDGEEAGRVFASPEARGDEGALIQTAIGQRDVRISPLQAANLMAAIARGGQPAQVRVVSRILYHNGVPFRHFPPRELDSGGIDPVTARKLARLLRQVVTDGTGSLLAETGRDAAGKSGTAQVTAGGKPRVHQWFAGFAPVNHPRFAIAVVAENRPANAPHLAAELFGRAVDALLSRR